jgi:hypothetical protein
MAKKTTENARKLGADENQRAFEEAARRIREEGEAMPFDEVLRRRLASGIHFISEWV